MAMIPDLDMFIGICLVTNMTLIGFFKMLPVLVARLQWLLEFGSNDLLAILYLF